MKPHIVILIGPDDLGKTSLGQMMSKKRGVFYRQVQAAKNPKNMTRNEIIESAFLEIDKWRKDDSGHTYVYDRFPFPDDWVYQELSGGEEKVRPVYQTPSEVHRVLENRLETVNAGFLLVMPNNRARYLDTYRDSLVKERHVMENIIERYCWLYQRTRIPTILSSSKWFDEHDADYLLQSTLDAIDEGWKE